MRRWNFLVLFYIMKTQKCWSNEFTWKVHHNSYCRKIYKGGKKRNVFFLEKARKKTTPKTAIVEQDDKECHHLNSNHHGQLSIKKSRVNREEFTIWSINVVQNKKLFQQIVSRFKNDLLLWKIYTIYLFTNEDSDTL